MLSSHRDDELEIIDTRRKVTFKSCDTATVCCLGDKDNKHAATVWLHVDVARCPVNALRSTVVSVPGQREVCVHGLTLPVGTRCWPPPPPLRSMNWWWAMLHHHHHRTRESMSIAIFDRHIVIDPTALRATAKQST